MKAFPLLLLLLSCAGVFSQNTSQYDNILLTTANEFRKAEPQVMLAADYVYSTPIDKTDVNRTNAIKFIMRWMQGTSDYSFPLDETVTRITKNDYDLIGVFMVCMTKYALSKGKGTSRDEIKINGYLMLATYCENPNNNYKVRGEIKKLIDAKNQDKLKEYLDSKN